MFYDHYTLVFGAAGRFCGLMRSVISNFEVSCFETQGSSEKYEPRLSVLPR